MKDVRFARSLRAGARMPVEIRDTIRRSVLSGQLRPGARVPSSRALANELGVSRNTVVDAYEQLLCDGYLESRRGAGTFVAARLAVRRSLFTATKPSADLTLSSRGRSLSAITPAHSSSTLRPFSPGLPALDPSILTTWFHAASQVRRRVSASLLTYGEAAGYRPLREAIAAHLGPTRGVTCVADQVIVTAGTQHALSIAAQLLLDPGDHVWMEDPGYPGASAALVKADAQLHPVPVGEAGLDVHAGMATAPHARAAYVSPSHQYPLGVTMSLARRRQLLEWAHSRGAWIFEDDYDSEFRFDGRTLPALQGLDGRDQVVYFGTFSKTLFPSLRMGYVIVPAHLAPAFARGVEIAGHAPPVIEQAALHYFIETGGYARHLKVIRALYEDRLSAFAEAVRKRLKPVLRLWGESLGLHIAGELRSEHDDRVLSERAAVANLSLPALSKYYGGPTKMQGFVMGYGHLSVDEIRRGVADVATLFRRTAG